jgi:galactokinase
MSLNDPTQRIETLQRDFTERFGRPPAVIVRAPGRVNLLGEHVDYNDGLVLPAAIDRAVYIAAAANDDESVSLHAIDLDQQAAFRLDQLAEKGGLNGQPLPSWAIYPAGVAWALHEAGLATPGMAAAYTSDVPIGSGLSSSAAVEVGFAVVWGALAGWQIDRLRLAQITQRGENAYVGVNSGLMDEFASACGVAGHALYFDTRSLEWQPAPIPAGVALVIADSGVRRSLTHSGYNERRTACEAAVAALQTYLPHIHSLRDVSTTEFAAYGPYLPDMARKRAEHVVKEIARVQSALTALQRSDLRALGALLYAGHASLRDLYEVSTPELDSLVELARPLAGCIGARLTGAGFGGCTINLVHLEEAPAFIEALSDGYTQKTGRQAQVYLCVASQGAEII